MWYECPTLATKTTDRAVLIGMRIAEARDAAGFNNSSLARATGIDRSNLRGLISGRNEPSVRTLEKIALATRKPLSFFQPERLRADLGTAVESLVDALMDDVRERLLRRAEGLVGAES